MQGTLSLICILLCGVGFSQDWKTKRFETDVSVQLYVSKPGPDRPPKNDPGLMLSQSYYLSEKTSAGLGTGILTPYYTTNLLPVFVQAKANVLPNSGLFIRGRIGKFVPFSPNYYEGGLFTELEVGHDVALSGRSKFRIAAGYSHQEMIAKNEIPWVQNPEISFKYNRAKISLGWVF